DVETVRAIREAVGPQVEIMLDANGAYDVGTAVRVGRQLEELNVAWLEEPVPADDLDGYAHLRRSVRVPLAAGETEFGLFGFRDLIARGCVDVLQPEVARIGGGGGPRPGSRGSGSSDSATGRRAAAWPSSGPRWPGSAGSPPPGGCGRWRTLTTCSTPLTRGSAGASPTWRPCTSPRRRRTSIHTSTWGPRIFTTRSGTSSRPHSPLPRRG